MRTFVRGTTRIDVVAQLSQEALELNWLVLSRFEGSETIAHAAFQTLVNRHRGKPLADYAAAYAQIKISGELSQKSPQADTHLGAFERLYSGVFTGAAVGVGDGDRQPATGRGVAASCTVNTIP